MESKLIGDFCCIHCIGQILLVGEDKKKSITELVFVQHSLQFLTGLGHTLSVVRVDDENNTLRVLEVCICVSHESGLRP